MLLKENFHVVFGVRNNGEKLRPSDWIERISSILASFGDDRRLRYSSSLKPWVVDGEPCLMVAQHLAQLNPGVYRSIMEFVVSNRLKVVTTASTTLPN
ncbi:MAG: DUF3579 domain-containing protein [Gammaproteobacteria bacterium]|nr:DUF3579 domain-containing protein [Gammaproteobacteria bacterium]